MSGRSLVHFPEGGRPLTPRPLTPGILEGVDSAEWLSELAEKNGVCRGGRDLTRLRILFQLRTNVFSDWETGCGNY